MRIGGKNLFVKRAKTLCPLALREIVYDIPKGPTVLRAETNHELFVRVPRTAGWDETTA